MSQPTLTFPEVSKAAAHKAFLAPEYFAEWLTEEARKEPDTNDPLPISFSQLQWMSGEGLVRPVQVRLERASTDVFTATEPTTGIHGAGPDLGAAVDDLRLAMREHLDVLQEAESLSAELATQLEFLRRHLFDRG